MALFRVTGNLGRFFSIRLLLLVAARVSLISGQQVGVSLMFLGETLPSDSFVDFDDILSIGSGSSPSNTNPIDGALVCVTDLEDCCGAPRTVRGDWYFPDGIIVGSDGRTTEYRVNRGANEEINGQTVYGSVRLYRRFSGAPERGRFHCELPNAANPSVNQILYANILDFGFRFNLEHVIISPSTGSTATTAGETDYSLTCSSTLFQPSRLPSGVPSPNFQWSINGSDSLPSGVTATATVVSSFNDTSETYSSTLQFSSPLSQSHTGMYTCRLGPGRLMNNIMISVNAPQISAMVTANLNTPLMVGQTDNTLTCGVSGAENLSPMITYQWTRNGITVQDSSSNTLSFSPLRLSQAGEYTCRASVGSTLLNGNIEASAGTPQRVEIQIPDPQSVAITISPDNIALCGSTVTVNCTVELNSAILESDLPLLMVVSQISRDGTPLVLTSQSVDGTTHNFGATVSSFGKDDIGNYTCTATIIDQPSSNFLTGMGQGEANTVEIIIGIPPTQLPSNTRCYSANDIAIAVVATTLIECLLAAPIITAVLVFCWKRNQSKLAHYKSDTTTTIQVGDVNPGEDVYEDPDKIAATTAPGKFKLTECPAYVATTSTLQPCSAADAQLQSGYYEL